MKQLGFTQLRYTNNIVRENKRLLDLWLKAKAGDGQAFGQLAESQYRILFNHAIDNFTLDRELIKDTIQDLFLHLWEHRNSIEMQYITIYLVRSMRNKLITKHRKKNPVSHFDDMAALKMADEADAFGNELVMHDFFIENEQKINDALTLLSKRQQKVIHLKFYQGLDNEQISVLMEMNRQSVANLLHRAVNALKVSVVSKPQLLVLYLLSGHIF